MALGYGPLVVIKGVCVICEQPFERKSHSGNVKRINKCGREACQREANKQAGRRRYQRLKKRRGNELVSLQDRN